MKGVAFLVQFFVLIPKMALLFNKNAILPLQPAPKVYYCEHLTNFKNLKDGFSDHPNEILNKKKICKIVTCLVLSKINTSNPIMNTDEKYHYDFEDVPFILFCISWTSPSHNQ